MQEVADLYVRVSTDEQAHTGFSQRHQEEMLVKFCELKSIRIRRIIFEDYSAKSFNRPEWNKMLAEYRKRKGLVDKILFLKWDRFSRNAGDSYAMISVLNKLGIEPQAIEQPLDLSVPENKMMLAFYLAAPEVENARRSMNVSSGMRRARKEGRHMGNAPIGYCNKVTETGKKHIAPKEPEASIIRWAFTELASGSTNVLALYNEAKAKGLGCSKNNFWNLIQNPVYCGKIIVPAYLQEESYVVNGIHEPIVSEELFYTAQDVLFNRKKPAYVRKPVHDDFPLRNFLVCPKCGKHVSASRSKGRSSYYNYYHCNSTCGWRYKAELVNDAFVQELQKYKPTMAMLSLYKEVILDVFNMSQHDNFTEKKAIVRQINEHTTRLSKARELLLSDVLDSADYKVIKAECERTINLLEAKLATVAPQEDNIDLLLEKALYNLAKIDVDFEQGDIQTKRLIIGSIFPEKLQFEENTFRTAKVNEAVTLICTLEATFIQNKTGQAIQKEDLSSKVVRPGFEPRLTEPKSVVLPLHHRTNWCHWDGKGNGYGEN